MITYFNLVGNVGRLTIKEVKTGVATYISVATSEYYNNKFHSQWINNIVAYGPVGKLIADRVTPGNKLYVSGTIKTYKKGKFDIVNFVIRDFRIINQTEEQKNEWLQKRQMENLPDDEDMYNAPPSDTDENNMPY